MAETKIATRREFLTQGLGLVGVGAALPNFLIQTALAAQPNNNNNRVLVLVELSGGHDGPSGLVPYGHEGYYRLRKATAIQRNEVIKLNDEVGLHPNLKDFRSLLDQGAFAVVPGCGYPNPNYSHFEAMDIWHVGNPEGRRAIIGAAGRRDRALGWVGRYFDQAHRGNLDPKLGLAVGYRSFQAHPLAMVGREHQGLSFNNINSFRYNGDRGDQRRLALYRNVNEVNRTPREEAVSDLDYVTHTAIHANSSSEQIRAMVGSYQTNITYPTSNLGNALKTVAGLIAGNLSTRVYMVNLGGFDTHSQQRPQHDRLMLDLNDSIAAFYKDLLRQGNASRVLSMTLSEFGRRPEENGSQGTDHGSAGPVFMFGPGVKAGVHGKHPSYVEFNRHRNFIHTNDFRNVYAAVLEKWLGTQSRPILGEGFQPVDCIA